MTKVGLDIIGTSTTLELNKSQKKLYPGKMTGHLTGDADFQRGILGTSLKEVLMSDTSQIALIRKLYGARGNVNVFKSLLADDLEYDIAEGFPNGGVYRGIDSVVNDFFAFLADFDQFYAEGDEYFE